MAEFKLREFESMLNNGIPDDGDAVNDIPGHVVLAVLVAVTSGTIVFACVFKFLLHEFVVRFREPVPEFIHVGTGGFSTSSRLCSAIEFEETEFV